MPKLIVIIGITGNQGGSVAQRFLADPAWEVRGITRDFARREVLNLAAQGVDIVQANLNDASSLERGFRGANLIFSVTDYWEPFFRPDCRAEAVQQGVSCRKYAYDVELRQGKNIADAAAKVVGGLDDNGFIASTLSHAGKCSGGEFEELYHFDAKADVFPYYVKEKHPELEKKMSCVQPGYYMSNYKLALWRYLGKQHDGSFHMEFPTAPDAKIPHLDVNSDMGNFVYAVSQLLPGRSYIAEGSTYSWPEYLRLWGEFNKVNAKYVEVSEEHFIKASPDEEFGIVAGEMFKYSSNPGYDGGDQTLLKASDIRKAGIECPMTSFEEYIKKQDWRAVLEQ